MKYYNIDDIINYLAFDHRQIEDDFMHFMRGRTVCAENKIKASQKFRDIFCGEYRYNKADVGVREFQVIEN